MKFTFLKTLTVKRSQQVGSALVELALTLPVAVSVVLGTIHLSSALREANIIEEAARHAARVVAAQSGVAAGPATLPAGWTCAWGETTCTGMNTPPAWAMVGSTQDSNNSSCSPTGDNFSPEPKNVVLLNARRAACDYMSTHFSNWSSGITDRRNWQIQARIVRGTTSLANTPVWYVSVIIYTTQPRGVVESLKSILNLSPRARSMFPMMRL